MFPMWQGWVSKSFGLKFMAAVLAAFSLLSAQTDSLTTSGTDSLAVPAVDTIQTVASADSLLSQMADSVPQLGSVPPSDSVTQSPDSVASTNSISKPLKSVLYLGGGEHSPWFHLGVLYAIESYSIPVDSVVGTSWGAYVGFLWAKGVSLDDIQRMLLDSDIENLVGHNSIDDLSRSRQRKFNLPVSAEGLPSLRHRFVVNADSSGALVHETKNIEKDSAQNTSVISRLRLQETLYRQPAGFNIPFAVLDCQGEMWNTVAKVMESLPLDGHENSGELCPYLALPLEDSPSELPIISVAAPIRKSDANPPWRSPWQKVIVQRLLETLNTQAGVIVRAHTVLDSSRQTWIQAGFSAMERDLSPR